MVLADPRFFVIVMDDDELISRKRKMDNRSDHDFLSDLPLNIIHCILALVPIRDAVRTCILSTQWRYKWASLPQLVFNDRPQLFFNDRRVDRSKSVECLKNIVTNVLLLHQGPIQKFSLCTSLLNSCPDTDRWLLCLSKNEIGELRLDIEYPWLDSSSRFRVPSSLYSCRKLTHLELYKCELRPPPLTFKGFSCLRSLVLHCVKVPCDVVESLVATSPLLENFISYESADGEFRISAPNLKGLYLVGDFKEISLYAPVVAEVSVEFAQVGFTAEQQQCSVCNYTKFLGGFTNLESLEVYTNFMKYLSIGIESYDHSLVFHHLKLIQLHGVNFKYKKQIAVLGHLIMGAPNLHELIFFLSTCSPNAPEVPPISYSDFGWAPNLTFNGPRVIHMYDHGDNPFGTKMEMDDLGSLCNKMELIKILLRSSTVLETITLSSCRQLGPDVISMLMTKLRSYSRASSNAKILLELPSLTMVA